VIQVFLVTTLTSAVSASLTQILEKPTSALTLLSANLPKASNFYISYILVQCLGFGASQLVPVFSLFYLAFVQKFSKDNRKSYERWHRMRKIHWGTKFPIFTNLGVISKLIRIRLMAGILLTLKIAMSYSLIAPVILGFSTVGFCFVYLIWRYELLYTYDSEIDTRGLVYPHALSHLLVGLYFAELCLIGLFSLKFAAGPVAIMIALVIFTILVHMSLLDAIGPLLTSLPASLTEEQMEIIDNNLPIEEPLFNDDPDDWGPEAEVDSAPEPGSTRALEGLPAGLKGLKSGITTLVRSKIKSETDTAGISLPTTYPWTTWLSPSPSPDPNLLIKWLHPEIFADASVFRDHVPSASVLPDPLYPPELARHVYEPPAMYADAPYLWIPRDAAGVSAQEVKHSSKVIRISDEDGKLCEDGRLEMDLDVVKYLGVLDRLRY
jgi:hypothetical protein